MIYRKDYVRPGNETREKLMEAQKGFCAICGRERNRPLDLDHNHKTGEPRGLLCRSCNNGLGLFEDDPKRLRAAADYLEK
jgi:hypothetical protein